jgi:hypothetical protein
MPHFPKQSEIKAYKCPGCSNWYFPSNISCGVLHAPGTCCHTYEREAAAPSSTASGRARRTTRR